MKFLIVAALVAVACADVSHLNNLNNQYLPPVQAAPSLPSYTIPTTQYLAPTVQYSAPITTYEPQYQYPQYQYPQYQQYQPTYAPAPVIAAPAPIPTETFQETAPAATFNEQDGYSYRNPNQL